MDSSPNPRIKRVWCIADGKFIWWAYREVKPNWRMTNWTTDKKMRKALQFCKELNAKVP